MVRELYIETYNAHKYLYDAITTAQVFIECMDKLSKIDELNTQERKFFSIPTKILETQVLPPIGTTIEPRDNRYGITRKSESQSRLIM
jgi:DNA polymerase III epsilon subunit-like protein